MASRVTPIDWQTPIVDPETGRPTQYFITVWNTILALGLLDLSDVLINNPTNGQTLTYSSAEGKWIAS